MRPYSEAVTRTTGIKPTSPPVRALGAPDSFYREADLGTALTPRTLPPFSQSPSDPLFVGPEISLWWTRFCTIQAPQHPALTPSSQTVWLT
jgi:hypothetical protein